jgi:uncharacterized protein
MLRSLPRYLLLLLLFLPGGSLLAEKVADLPIPTTYVNDFAHILSPAGSRNIEDLCLQVHRQANAELVVVTIKTLDDGQSIEEFTAALEEKWKLGKKGAGSDADRSALIVLSLNPKRLRVETGYGLEGILNDAKVGRILDPAVPYARSGDYDRALMTTVQGLADVIAADKGVTLTPIVHQYHRQAAPPQPIGPLQIALGVGFVILVVILALTGNLGWAFYLLLNILGNGRGGGGGDGDRGGGFGGVGGGSSGGGGASRDF